jgi:hypothetical protein
MDATLGYALQTLILSIKRGERILSWARQALDPYIFELPIAQKRNTKKSGDIY